MGDLSRDFSRHEFACKCGCGFNTADSELLRILQQIRNHFDKKVTITSGCRCKSHNQAAGGGKNSQHLLGRASDIVVDGVPPDLVAELAGQLGAGGVGRYPEKGFTHIDTRSHEIARWTG